MHLLSPSTPHLYNYIVITNKKTNCLLTFTINDSLFKWLKNHQIKQSGIPPFHFPRLACHIFVCSIIKFICEHSALWPHRGELVSDMSHIATSAQNGGDASIASGQHTAFAFSTRNQKHLFSNPGMLSNLALRHWRVYRLWATEGSKWNCQSHTVHGTNTNRESKSWKGWPSPLCQWWRKTQWSVSSLLSALSSLVQF